MRVCQLVLVLFLSLHFSNLYAGVERESIWNARSQAPHKFHIINQGTLALEKRLKLIESAQESIELEYFIYNTDHAGRLLTQALVKKAKEGVKVRILLDHFLTKGEIDPFIAHRLKKVGVEVRFYNTVPLIRAVSYQYRNHRKSLIVDNHKAILGGRNIGDDYFDLSDHYNFLDRDVYLEGPIVDVIRQTFDEYWMSGPAQEVKRPSMPHRQDIRYMRHGRSSRSRSHFEYVNDLHDWKQRVKHARRFTREMQSDRELRQKVSEIAAYYEPQSFKGVCHDISFASDRPGVGTWTKERRILRYVIYDRMKNISDRLIIDSPYFILNEDTTNILKGLLDDKKSIEVLTNGLYSTDAIYVAAVFNDKIGSWLERGLEAVIYGGKLHPEYKTIGKEVSRARWGTHSKSMVYDNDSVMIGSWNFDPRSMVYSTELAVFCDGSPEIAEALTQNIHHRMAQGPLLKTKEDVKEHALAGITFGKKLAYYLIKLPSLWLKHLL